MLEDRISDFSQTAAFLDLLAPGESIKSSIPGGGFDSASGTSIAAPHVTGAWAALRALAHGNTVDTIRNARTSTGVLVTDTRGGMLLRKPRIQVDVAAESLLSTPLPPSSLRVAVSGTTPSIRGTSVDLAWG